MSSEVPRYDAGVAESEDLLCLHRNENLFVGPDWTVDTAARLVARARLGSYPDPSCRELRGAIGRLYGLGPEHVFVGNGSDEVLSDVLGYLRERHDVLRLLDVHFKVYDLLAHRFHYRRETLPGDTFSSGQVELDGWDGLAVLDSPNAITSRAVAGETMAAIVADPDRFLVWDNAYGEYAEDVMPEVHPRRLVVRSFSKFFGIAALRVGYCVGHPEVVAELLARKDIFNVNGLGQVMALEGIGRYAEFEALADEMRRCRKELIRYLDGHGFLSHPAAAHFVLTRHPEIHGEVLHRELLARKVAVRRFPGGPTDPYIRITVPPMSQVEQLTAALDEILEGEPAAAEGRSSDRDDP